MRNIKMKESLLATMIAYLCFQSGALAQKQLEWKDDIAAGEVAYKAGENQIAEKCFLSALQACSRDTGKSSWTKQLRCCHHFE